MRFVATALCCIACLISVFDIAKAETLPEGTKPLTEAQFITVSANKHLYGSAYDRSGKLIGAIDVHFKPNNRYDYKIKRNTGGTVHISKFWFVREEKFCRTFPPPERFVCGTRGLVHYKNGVCYTLWPDSDIVAVKYGCVIE